MKRILFCAGILALAASCTEDEFDSFATQNGQTQGITFTAEAPVTKIQWDETETSYVPFWYAEQDRIAIYGIGVLDKNGSKLPNNAGDSWDEISTSVEYKATQSEKIGKFTAVNDDNMLKFDGSKEARFLGLYPETVEAEWNAAAKGLKISSLPTLGTQTQETTKGYNKNVMMYSLSTASKVNDYDAVGENASLSFQRPFSALVLSTDNANEYTTGDAPLFGKLKTVEVEAKGYTPAQGDAIEPSELTIAANDYLVVDTLTNEATFVADPAGARASKVTLNIGTAGLGWSDDALAVTAINNVDRSQTFAKAGKDETIEITWTFDNIVLKQSLNTQNSWKGFVETPKLDISSYDYLVTKDHQLLVLNGNFKDIFDKDGKIAWDNGAVDKTSITNIISKVALSDAELAMLQGFSGLKKLTLAENTEIPANTFSETQAGQITDLNLPKVTKVAQKFIANNASKAFSKLENLSMPAYEFEDDVVNKAFFNDDVQATLASLDMSGVRSMLPQFGIERTLSFEGYTNLAEVTVQDGMVVSPSGFAGCIALATVNGAVDVTNAPKAFSMASNSVNNVLKSIEVTGTEIPSYAFYYCKALETIEYKGAQLAPTVVGDAGLAVTAIKYMDLSKLTSLGEKAFKMTKIISSNKNTTYLEVGAAEIPAEAFSGCADLKMVKFTNATTITGDKVFENATTLIQVKFLKVVSLGSGTDFTNVFGGKEGSIDLWVNPEQSGVNGLNWTLEYINGKNVETVKYTFKSIQKKIED